MIDQNGDVKCDICGLVMRVIRDLNVTADSSDGVLGAFYKTHLNVCDKCLPNLLVMLEVAMIKTSMIMVEENSSYAECIQMQDGNEDV